MYHQITLFTFSKLANGIEGYISVAERSFALRLNGLLDLFYTRKCKTGWVTLTIILSNIVAVAGVK